MANWYVDTSALAKLVVVEPDSEALRSFLEDGRSRIFSSVISRVELLRVALRHDERFLSQAEVVWSGLEGVALSGVLLTVAGSVTPATLRSLDAIHLATALDLGSIIAGVVTYDKRLAEACALYGLGVVAPT